MVITYRRILSTNRSVLAAACMCLENASGCRLESGRPLDVAVPARGTSFPAINLAG